MDKKIKTALLSAGIAVVIFIISLSIQSNILHPNGVSKVVYAQRPISANTNITKDNVNYYFATGNSDNTMLIESPVRDKEALIGKYITSDILKGSPISSKETGNTADRLKDIKNLTEFSITFSDISSCVNGTLREGDVIDLVGTQVNGTVTVTKPVLTNVIVSKAFTADGQVVTRESGNKFAASKLNLYGTPEDQLKLQDALAKGKVQAVKALN